MIRIQRADCPPSLDPADPDAAGPRELDEIKLKIANGDQIKSEDFNAYKNLDVRNALRVMFHGKCAYCESKIAGSQDTDIEHYRPKKGVTEAKDAGVDHPGYWWLAMVWDNLVLSCMHCNQSRSKQIIIPDDLETEEEMREFLENPKFSRAGKQNSFPTSDDTWILEPEGDITTENPLIINPVDIDPEDHLDWKLDQWALVVVAKNGSPIGDKTRQILGLNRRWLEEDRRIHLLEMLEDRADIIDNINSWLTANDTVESVKWEKSAQRAIERLIRKTEDQKQFAGLARAFLKSVQSEVEAMQATDA